MLLAIILSFILYMLLIIIAFLFGYCLFICWNEKIYTQNIESEEKKKLNELCSKKLFREIVTAIFTRKD